MRRAIARGRVFPQSYSTDRRYGRLSLKACALFPLMWANSDDQGRLCGDPEEVKYICCPNIDHIAKSDVPGILKELQDNKLIRIYETPKSPVIQMLDWWEVNQKMQWAWPSEYPPSDGWTDRLRYKKDALTVVTENWPSPEPSGERQQASQVKEAKAPAEHTGENTAKSILNRPQTGEASPEGENESQVKEKEPSPESTREELQKPSFFPHTPNIYPGNITRRERGIRRGRGNSPEDSGETSPSSPATAGSDFRVGLDTEKFIKKITACFEKEWARVPAGNPEKIIPRQPGGRESAQIRDLAEEISAAGGCPIEWIDEAFRDAAGRPDKMHVSYVRRILLDWLGVKRAKSP